MTTLGEKLKVLREKKKLLQKEVASELNIKSQTYSRYENNLRVPDIHTLVKIANYYKVSTDYLLGVDKDYIDKKQILTDIKDIQRILLSVENLLEKIK